MRDFPREWDIIEFTRTTQRGKLSWPWTQTFFVSDKLLSTMAYELRPLTFTNLCKAVAKNFVTMTYQRGHWLLWKIGFLYHKDLGSMDWNWRWRFWPKRELTVPVMTPGTNRNNDTFMTPGVLPWDFTEQERMEMYAKRSAELHAPIITRTQHSSTPAGHIDAQALDAINNFEIADEDAYEPLIEPDEIQD